MLFAIYDNGVFVRLQELAEKPTLDGKPWRKFYSVETVDPAFDPATHVKSGPTIEDDHQNEVRRLVYAVRVKTPQEISADKDTAVAMLNGGYGPLIKALLSLHNRVRVLEGQPEHTLAQFRAGLKAML